MTTTYKRALCNMVSELWRDKMQPSIKTIRLSSHSDSSNTHTGRESQHITGSSFTTVWVEVFVNANWSKWGPKLRVHKYWFALFDGRSHHASKTSQTVGIDTSRYILQYIKLECSSRVRWHIVHNKTMCEAIKNNKNIIVDSGGTTFDQP